MANTSDNPEVEVIVIDNFQAIADLHLWCMDNGRGITLEQDWHQIKGNDLYIFFSPDKTEAWLVDMNKPSGKCTTQIVCQESPECQ